MHDIFISHVEEDRDVALRSALGLEELGYATWLYEIDSLLGESYLRRSSVVINESKVVLVIISNHVCESPRQVEVEVVHAYEKHKRLMPILYGMTHGEFQKSPQLVNIIMALGAATSVPIPPGGISRVLPKIADALRSFGVGTRAIIAHDRIERIRDEIREGGASSPEPPPAAIRAEVDVPPPPLRGPSRRFIAFGAAATLGLIALGVGGRYLIEPTSPRTTTTTLANVERVFVIGVMDFSAHSGAPPWMCESTRTNVNLVLSKFRDLQVFAAEKIDFVIKKKGLEEIEAAEFLKITKMIRGAVSLNDGKVTIEAHVVDVATGLMERPPNEQPPARVTGPEEKLIELQNEIALTLVEQLNVVMDPKLVKAIRTERKNENLEDYKLLTETLGGVAEKEKNSHAPPRSRQWFAILSPADVHAADPDDESAVRGVLEAYRAALEAEDLEKLSTIQLEMSESQKGALAKYFQNAEELQIQFSNYDILLVGDDAVATFTRRDVFKDAKTGREVRLEVRISSELTKKMDGWHIMGLKKPS